MTHDFPDTLYVALVPEVMTSLDGDHMYFLRGFESREEAEAYIPDASEGRVVTLEVTE